MPSVTRRDEGLSSRGMREKFLGMFNSQFSEYLSALASIKLPASIKAQAPFENHAWVFAAGMLTAIVGSQCPLVAMRETETQSERRKRDAGRYWRGPRSGAARRAWHRHSAVSTQKRFLSKSAEPLLEHPTMDLLAGKANSYQNGNQLMQITHLWLAVRGECFWVKTMEDGSSPGLDEMPDQLWPLSPDLFRPLTQYGGDIGPIVGWEISLPKYMQLGGASRIRVPITDVVHFKYPNPSNITRGMSRLSAAAMGIETDLMVRAHSRNLLERGAIPRGIVMHEDNMEQAEEKEFQSKWEETYGGADKVGRTAVLTGGFKYVPIQMSPVDLAFLDSMRWERDEILACMGVPKSVMGVTENLNYATQLGQDANFWDKTIVPMYRVEEAAIDEGLFTDEMDDVFPLHDLRNVEALRAGLADKIGIAKQLTSSDLHVPPRQAFEVAGVEVEEYAGDDVALVSPLLSPVSSVIDAAANPPEEVADEEVPKAAVRSFVTVHAALTDKTKKARSRASQFVKVQAPVEARYRTSYRGWLAGERKIVMARLDSAGTKSSVARVTLKEINPGAIIPSWKDMGGRLKDKITPISAGALDIAFQFTSDDLGGIVTFELDDPRILQFFNDSIRGTTTVTPTKLETNLRNAVAEGVKAGETLGQIRARVAQVFDVSSSSARSLMWARTESASFMNGSRDVMFDAAGIEDRLWSNSGDDGVRPDHETFMEAGPQKKDFNYLTLVGQSGGVLEYPGDFRCAVVSQKVNCRCTSVPA